MCGGTASTLASSRKNHGRRRELMMVTVILAVIVLLLSFVPLADAFFMSPQTQTRRRRYPVNALNAQATKKYSILESTAATSPTSKMESPPSPSVSMESSSFMPMMKRPDRPMEIMATAGLAFSSFIIYGLAMSDKIFIRGLEREGLEDTANTILDAALPMTSADVVAVAFGEAAAGVFSAALWFAISTLFNKIQRMDLPGTSSSTAASEAVNAVADSDVFVTKAATYPVFEAFGLTPVAASIASVIVSVIPSGLVKLGKRRKQLRKEEDLELELLLLQQKQQQQTQAAIIRQGTGPLGFVTEKIVPKKESSAEQQHITTADVPTLTPVVELKDSFAVETFADIIKWLEFDILRKEYGGLLGLPPSIEGAIFGILCAVSSQMYTDLLYIGFGIQGESKRLQLLSRTGAEWSAVYLYRCISVAALFGVYQAVQLPAKMLIGALMTGSLDACIGSEDFALCNETFQYFNPPDKASIVTEVRALAVQLLALWDRIADILNV